MASKVTSSGTALEANRVRRRRGPCGQSHGQTPKQQLQSTSGSAQHTRSKTSRMAAAFATPLAGGYKTALKSGYEERNLLRLKRVRRMTTTMRTLACRGGRWRWWIPGSPRPCSIRFPRALRDRMQRQFFTPFRCSCRHLHRSNGVVITAPFYRRVFRSYSLMEWMIHMNGYGGDRTALGVPDAPCLGASCGSWFFRGF